MTSFPLILRDSSTATRIDGVVSFVGEDASGSFGILPGHARFMTILELGLARFRRADAAWQYLAMPGAVLYFKDNLLSLSTRRYFLDQDYERIIDTLTKTALIWEEPTRNLTRWQSCRYPSSPDTIALRSTSGRNMRNAMPFTA